MAPKITNQDREELKEAAAEGLRVISNAADAASKVIVQSAADAVRVLTAAAADAAKVVSNAAAVSSKVVDEKTGTDHDAIIRIEADLKTLIRVFEEGKTISANKEKRISKLEESRTSLNILISIGISILTVETALLLWNLFKIHP